MSQSRASVNLRPAETESVGAITAAGEPLITVEHNTSPGIGSPVATAGHACIKASSRPGGIVLRASRIVSSVKPTSTIPGCCRSDRKCQVHWELSLQQDGISAQVIISDWLILIPSHSVDIVRATITIIGVLVAPRAAYSHSASWAICSHWPPNCR